MVITRSAYEDCSTAYLKPSHTLEPFRTACQVAVNSQKNESIYAKTQVKMMPSNQHHHDHFPMTQETRAEGMNEVLQ